MRTNQVVIMLFIILVCGISRAAEPVDFEIITMFAEKVVEMPKGMISAPISDVNFDPPTIKETLLRHKAHTISIAFPDYDPADSLIESPRFARYPK